MPTKSVVMNRLYSYDKDRDGVFDVFTIRNPLGEYLSLNVDRSIFS